MITFANLRTLIASAYTGGALKNSLWWQGVPHPANMTDMYLNGESPEYMVAACMAIQTIGA